MVKVLGRPFTIMTESRVRESRVVKPNKKVYVYGKVDLILPPEFAGRKVRIIALVYDDSDGKLITEK